MPNFAYKARNAAGQLNSGVLLADSLAAASGQLRADGWFIVKLEEASARRAAKGHADRGSDASAVPFSRRGGRITRTQIIGFAHQLAVMVDTGVPISEALRCIAEQADTDELRRVVEDVAEQVEAGGELSRALSQHEKAFPPIMVSLVRASELSGTMGRMLERISQYLGKEHQTYKKVKGALTYPAVMLTMVLLVTVGLLVWVLPRFATIFASKGATLPLPTRLLMAVSHSLMGYWYFWVGGLIALVLAVLIGKRSAGGRYLIDRLKIGVPVLGPLFRQLYVTRSVRTMGTMIDAGVPVLDMIDIVRDVTRNAVFEELWDTVHERLQRGAQLSDALFESPLIPRSVSQMIYAGEKSGRLGATMNKIAHFTEEEFDEQIRTTTNLIEPAMVGLMGGIVGFVAIALLLPIFSVSSVVSS